MAVLKQRREQLEQKKQELKGSFLRFDKFLQVGGACWGGRSQGHKVTILGGPDMSQKCLKTGVLL